MYFRNCKAIKSQQYSSKAILFSKLKFPRPDFIVFFCIFGRISFFLFDQTPICEDALAESSFHGHARIVKYHLGYFFPFGYQALLQCFDGSMRLSSNSLFHQSPNAKVQWIEVRWGRWPVILRDKCDPFVPQPLLGDFRAVRRCRVLLKDPRLKDPSIFIKMSRKKKKYSRQKVKIMQFLRLARCPWSCWRICCLFAAMGLAPALLYGSFLHFFESFLADPSIFPWQSTTSKVKKKLCRIQKFKQEQLLTFGFFWKNQCFEAKFHFSKGKLQ